MISLKKYLESASPDSDANRAEKEEHIATLALEAYGSALEAIGAYSLEQSTNIGSSAHWTPVAATPTPVNGTTYQVTVPISGKTSFYQLILTNLPGNF